MKQDEPEQACNLKLTGSEIPGKWGIDITSLRSIKPHLWVWFSPSGAEMFALYGRSLIKKVVANFFLQNTSVHKTKLFECG